MINGARVLRTCVTGALLVCAADKAWAQLDEHCTVSVLNRSVTVNHDGSWVLPNVPANFGLVRARATCIVNGQTISGESDLFAVPPNGVVNLKPIVFGRSTPIPVSLTVTASAQTLTQAGATLQLEAFARYPNGTLKDVTSAAAGTAYTTSNPAIATVSGDGLVRAIASGTVIVQATLEGASGLFSIRVVQSSTDSDGDGVPDDYELAHGMDPNNPLDAQEDPDRDGLTTLQEFQLGTDPRVADTDGDGLLDGDEVNVYHTNALLADTDGDGIPDGVEVGTASNPLDRNSYDLKKAAASSVVAPPSFVLNTSTLFPNASQLLNWKVTLIDGRTTLDLTSDPRTSYASSALTICNFGSEKGRIFAGSPGTCVITITNSTLSATASGTVQAFTPTALSFVDVSGFANNVAIAGNYAYVAAGSAGLQVIDVSNRTAPFVAASRALAGNANDVVVMANYAYVAAGTAGLQIVNIEHPLAPTVAGSVGTGGVAWDVVVVGSRAYVANGANGLIIVDVSSPSAPVVLGALGLSGTTKGVDVDAARQVAVVARGTAGLSVINVADPSAPSLLATLAGGDIRDVAIAGNYAFLADFSRSFTSVDISNPASPVLRASTTSATGGLLQDVAVNGTLAAGADVFFVNGVPLVDVSAPASPQPRSILDFSRFRDDNGTGIAMDSTFVYLTAEAGTISENGVTGTTRLYIGQYRSVQDDAGVPPTVQITAPADGTQVIQGSTVTIAANAADDVAVAQVNFFVNGQIAFTTTSAPYRYTFTVPEPTGTLTIGAAAVDFGGNAGVAPNVRLTMIPDPLTTIAGRVIDHNGVPASGATVTVLTFTTTTAADGTFTIANVPTARGSLVVSATAIVGGRTVRGRSAPTVPIAAGTTNVGDIRLLGARILFVWADNDATEPLTVIPAAAAAAGLFSAQEVDSFSVWHVDAPTLAQLQNYAAVLVWSSQPFHGPAALGNVLADYVDSGGGVVTASFAHFDNDGFHLEGRLLTGGYLGFVPGGGVGSNILSLSNSNTGHPIMQGVTGDLSFARTDFHGYSLTPGSTVVARDTANYPKVAIGPNAGGHVVSIAIYPGAVPPLFPQLSPGIARLFANALDFVR